MGYLVCRVKYDVIKESALFLESLIVGGNEGRVCIGGGSGGGRIRKDMLRSDNKEKFYGGCWFRDEDRFELVVGFIIGIHTSVKWMGKQCVGVMVWCNEK